MAPIIASTVVQLANLAVIAYGIQATRTYLIHWLNTRASVGPLLFRGRTAQETALDDERRAA